MQASHRAHGYACITETALARVIAVRGAAQPHFVYLLANRRATRVKMRVYDGFGLVSRSPT
ncbi:MULTISPECIES: transposase [Pseudomonas]|uniref:Transposase n=1 Tax=Pseudomonas petroselini TaxID=2899822 RepID=A0ABS8QN95_9PSED|nr:MULTISPECIES: transposase [Pseudomonas]MCD7037066.1 transposase [Pseudomonas petroselini]MCD7043974.1 transposase [Pseudomonas petroselini]MCM2380505.1 transposase [Pseudomonas marginalis]MDD2034633.1 transposase [Pseudomonas sp. 39167]